MATNRDKVVDRTPFILPAGKISESFGDSVANCLKSYTLDDVSDTLRSSAKFDTKPEYKSESYKNKMRKGIFTDIQPILQPKVKSRYQTLINELKETTYKSHWEKVVGKGKDATPALPKGFKPEEVTFGIQSNKHESVKELINPSKGVYQVLSESQVAHELYKKSHNDYNIGEKIDRNYLAPAFDKSKRFGYHSKYDPRGIWVRCACNWHKSEPVVFTNKIQADFLNKTRSRLGEHRNVSNAPEKVSKPNKRDLYGVEELLKDGNCPPCVFKQDLKCWLKSFNKLRIHVKKLFNYNFTSNDLYKRLLYYDEGNCGILPLGVFYKVCSCYGFTFDRENMEPLLRLLSIVCDNNINYSKFLKILDFKTEPMELVKIEDIPESAKYYLTTNQSATCDYLIIDNSDSPVAGIPSIRYDLPRPVVPSMPGRCRADVENLGDECSAGVLLNPSIYFNYGLSFRDFFLPREKELIRNLFESAGYKIDDSLFEKLWSLSVEHDKTGLVCVDTFNKYLQKHYCDQKQIIVDEATC